MKKKHFLVFGGTFDPTHLGHIQCPAAIVTKNKLDGIIYVPAGVPPHKRHKKISSGDNRKKILELSLSNVSYTVYIEDFELVRDGVLSYTVDTLEYLTTKHPDAEFSLAVGSDQAEVFHRWKETRRIEQLAKPVCMARAGYENFSGWKHQIVEVPSLKISSTLLRAKLCQGLYDDELVTTWMHPLALDYIREKKLYELV